MKEHSGLKNEVQFRSSCHSRGPGPEYAGYTLFGLYRLSSLHILRARIKLPILDPYKLFEPFLKVFLFNFTSRALFWRGLV
jgi:hypothetical protein